MDRGLVEHLVEPAESIYVYMDKKDTYQPNDINFCSVLKGITNICFCTFAKALGITLWIAEYNVLQLFVRIKRLWFDVCSLNWIPCGITQNTRQYSGSNHITNKHQRSVNQLFSDKEKKKEIWLSPMTKPPLPTENSQTKGQHTNASKNFDNTTDRLRTLCWSNKSSNWCG